MHNPSPGQSLPERRPSNQKLPYIQCPLSPWSSFETCNHLVQLLNSSQQVLHAFPLLNAGRQDLRRGQDKAATAVAGRAELNGPGIRRSADIGEVIGRAARGLVQRGAARSVGKTCAVALSDPGGQPLSQARLGGVVACARSAVV